MLSRLKKRLTLLVSLLISSTSVSAIGLLGITVLIAVIVVIGVGIACLLKRMADIPPIDRERQIRSGTMPGQGDIWPYYTNHGLPPSFTYVDGVDPWPMTVENIHPLPVPGSTNGETFNYFEMVKAQHPPIIEVCCMTSLNGPKSFMATVGSPGANYNGFTNENCEISIINGRWDIRPTASAVKKYPCMFWEIKKK